MIINIWNTIIIIVILDILNNGRAIIFLKGTKDIIKNNKYYFFFGISLLKYLFAILVLRLALALDIVYG